MKNEKYFLKKTSTFSFCQELKRKKKKIFLWSRHRKTFSSCPPISYFMSREKFLECFCFWNLFFSLFCFFFCVDVGASPNWRKYCTKRHSLAYRNFISCGKQVKDLCGHIAQICVISCRTLFRFSRKRPQPFIIIMSDFFLMYAILPFGM